MEFKCTLSVLFKLFFVYLKLMWWFFLEMFKKFEEKENVSSVQQLKSSVQKGIVMIQFFLQYCSWKTRQLHYDRRPVFDIDVWCGVRLFRHFLVIATYNDG